MNETIRAISNFFISLRKNFEQTKSTKSTKTQTSKQKQKNQHFHAHKNIYGEESCLFVFLYFLFGQGLFVKKDIEVWNCPNSLIHITTYKYWVSLCMCVHVCVFVFIPFQSRSFLSLQWCHKHTWVWGSTILSYEHYTGCFC